MRRPAGGRRTPRRSWLGWLLIVYLALGVVVMHADPGLVPPATSHSSAMSMPPAPLTVTADGDAPHRTPADPNPCQSGGQVCLSTLPPASPTGWLGIDALAGAGIIALAVEVASRPAIRLLRRRGHPPPDRALLGVLRV